MTSALFPQRGNGYAKELTTNGHGLPLHSSAVREKWQRHHHTSSWLIPISFPIPGVPTRRLRLMAPNPARLHQFSITRFGRRRGPIVLCVAVLVTLFTVFALHKRFATEEKTWPTLTPADTTLVYRRADLQRIWEWEVSAGHYPSSRKSMFVRSNIFLPFSDIAYLVPENLGLSTPPLNPALPVKKSATIPPRFRAPTITNTIGAGRKRIYLDIQNTPPNVAYPPRPVPGSVADMDVIMDHCDFSNSKVCALEHLCFFFKSCVSRS